MPESDLALVSKTIGGDVDSRNEVTQIVHPIICYQSSRFCKQYCFSHKNEFVCSLVEYAYPRNPTAIDLCEWGNGSYAWMLEDLTNNDRLTSFEARNDATLRTFFLHIANSPWFKERWKDWRLGGRAHVPVSIQRLSDIASRVFWGLYNNESLENIAQKHDFFLNEVY